MMEQQLRTYTTHFSSTILRGLNFTKTLFLAFFCISMTMQNGQSQTCAKSLGNAQVLCFSPNDNGPTTVFLAEGNAIVQKVSDNTFTFQKGLLTQGLYLFGIYQNEKPLAFGKLILVKY